MQNNVIELIDVVKRYEGGAGSVDVLDKVSLQVKSGSAIAVTGPSGSGKSTLLNIMGTLDRADSGEVRIDGIDVGGLDDSGLCKIRREKAGFVFQQHHLLPQCDVLENVLIPSGAESGMDVPEDYARELIERVGLSARIGHRPSELSGGECQRVALVRALINKPAVLLADEPTGSLDRKASDELTRLMLEINSAMGAALVVVTHSETLAAAMGQRYLLKDGKLEPVSGI